MKTVNEYVREGYRVLSDGPTGTYLENRKSMTTPHSVLFLAGLIMPIWNWKLGLVMCSLSLIHFLVFYRPASVWVSRDGERVETPESDT